MMKNKVLIFTCVIFMMFLVGTIISLFIVYKDIDGNIAIKFIMGYFFLTFFMLIYIPFITIINSRKLKWIAVRKRLFMCIILSVIFGALSYGLDFIFRPSSINLYREFSIAFGLAFGITFIDVIFLKKNQN